MAATTNAFFVVDLATASESFADVWDIMAGGGICFQYPGCDPGKPREAGHVVLSAGELRWAAAPPSLPAGAQAAVLEGNPAEAGPFTMRLRVPANYKIPPHWHPAIEHVTVLSGSFHVGLGEKWDETKGKTLSAGSFAVMPPQMSHFAWTTQETIIQLHGIGPWGITYLKPADDPRNK